MSTLTKICIPENDPSSRSYIGRKGTNSLLIMTSHANPLEKDNDIVKRIDKIASANGYDGWILWNLTPERSTHPGLLKDQYHRTDQSTHRGLLSVLLDNELWGFKNVWLAWGDNVLEKNYLQEQAYLTLDSQVRMELNYWYSKKTANGHPAHLETPFRKRRIDGVETTELLPFKIKSYIRKIKPYGWNNEFTLSN